MHHHTLLRNTSLPFTNTAAARLHDDDARELFASLVEGTRVVISSTSLDAQRLIRLRSRREGELADGLDARERAVAHLVGLGWANKQIAAELGLSCSTVARAIDRATRVMGLGGRVDLALLVAAIDRAPGAKSHARASMTLDPTDGTILLAVSLGESPLWACLSPAERAVVELALAGHRASTIARLRGDRSQRTVANQLSCVFRKVGVSGRTELASRLLAG